MLVLSGIQIFQRRILRGKEKYCSDLGSEREENYWARHFGIEMVDYYRRRHGGGG